MLLPGMQKNISDPNGRKMAAGLGWFSIGLGAFEVLAPRSLARTLGMRGRESQVQLYGLREIATGIGILASKDPSPWLWGRVAGDALDIGTLAAHCTQDNPRKGNVVTALCNVALVTAFDVYCAARLTGKKQPERVFDYSDRSGFPHGMRAVLANSEWRMAKGGNTAHPGRRGSICAIRYCSTS